MHRRGLLDYCHGPTGTVELAFEGEYTRFSNLAQDERLPAH